MSSVAEESQNDPIGFDVYFDKKDLYEQGAGGGRLYTLSTPENNVEVSLSLAW